MNRQRITIRYEGRVQGVGFRYTAQELARNLGVCGRVTNELDGSVTLIAEGPPDRLMELLQAIQSGRLERFITAEQTRRTAATGEFSDFRIT
jgi:acylphosphatase